MNEQVVPAGAEGAPDVAVEANSPGTTAKSTPQKTPMFSATNAHRYQRQELIKRIRQTLGRPLICYVAGIGTAINRDDVVALVDLLHNIPRDTDLDFLLHTPGGDIDAAEKLITLVRTVVGEKTLRVIVPDFAKSAGTLVALGADRIVMSNSSELGPIDPQITLNDGQGNLIQYSVQSYLDAYEAHSMTLQKSPGDVAAQIMLNKLDPARLKLFEAARLRARSCAEHLLRRWMFGRATGAINITHIAGQLIDTKKWQSHGQMINHEHAKDIGLSVEYLDHESAEWQLFWQLYCHQRLAITTKQKLFESDYASLTFDI